MDFKSVYKKVDLIVLNMRKEVDHMKEKTSCQNALIHLFEEGSIALPVVFLSSYKKLGLTEEEVMLIIHIIVYQEKAEQPLPSIEALSTRMNLTTKQIAQLFKKLTNQGFLEIIEEINEYGLRSERYSIVPLYQKLSETLLAEESDVSENENKADYERLFHRFEQEFGRPLSPFECEHLSQWLDQDGYSGELVEAALREAVFCGKVNFRYIDRILLEWQRNQVRTPEEAVEYSKRFRQKGLLYSSEPSNRVKKKTGFSFYNWVNQE